MTAEVVLDSSAVLALINGEPGGTAVADALPGATISTVNLAEVLNKLIDRGGSHEKIRELISELPIESVPFDARQAWAVSTLRPLTRKSGLSLADNVCIALAGILNRPAWTADRVWADLDLDIKIKLIR